MRLNENAATDRNIISVWNKTLFFLSPVSSFLLFQNTVTMIPAHDSPVAALTFNASATKLATASEKVRKTFEVSDPLR